MDEHHYRTMMDALGKVPDPRTGRYRSQADELITAAVNASRSGTIGRQEATPWGVSIGMCGTTCNSWRFW